ncbi:MAG: arsenical resistance operon transcriptional repressor ArsD [Balneolaceae bacterium]|nr:MAG: arsenical resistance operon transcriptional repressor ArsD [Balneolaceae bacterium]
MNQETETTTLLEVYDPVLCCSTGVCGPDVDDALVNFAQDVKWLESQNVTVRRYNLGQEPEKFRDNPEILKRLQDTGSEILPILVVNGEIVSEGGYPNREQLESMLAVRGNQASGSHEGQENKTNGRAMTEEPEPSANTEEPEAFHYSEKVEILINIGSSVAAGCESCLKAHFVKGKKAGLSKEDMARAMQSGLNARQVPMSDIIGLANKLLGNPAPSDGCTPGGGCC